LAPSPTIERADKSEQLLELTRKDRRASPSPRASPRERHRGRTSRESGCDVKKDAAPRMKAQSTESLTKTKGFSTDDEQGARSSPASSRRSRSSMIMRLSQRAESSFCSSSENSIHEHTITKHILKPPKYVPAGSFETFFAQSQNCASYNKWTKREQLVYLRSSLEKSAGKVLWD